MGIHPETTELAPDAPGRTSARPGRAIPLRHWLLLALALVTLSAPVLATSTAAATALARPVTGAQLRAAASHELPDAGTTLPVALGLLGLAVMGRRPRELAQ
jgi:hypothetical protein